jgi:hypothetical protein
MKTVSFLIVFIAVMIFSFVAEAGNARRPTYAADQTAIVDTDNGRSADVDSTYDALTVKTAGGDSMTYANADETVISTGCMISSISFLADTAGEDVLIYDGNGTGKVLKWRIMNGLANSTKEISFPGGLKFNDDVYVDVDAGDEVYICYTAE